MNVRKENLDSNNVFLFIMQQLFDLEEILICLKEKNRNRFICLKEKNRNRFDFG